MHGDGAIDGDASAAGQSEHAIAGLKVLGGGRGGERSGAKRRTENAHEEIGVVGCDRNLNGVGFAEEGLRTVYHHGDRVSATGKGDAILKTVQLRIVERGLQNIAAGAGSRGACQGRTVGSSLLQASLITQVAHVDGKARAGDESEHTDGGEDQGLTGLASGTG